MLRSQKRLGEILLAKGLLTSEQLAAALEEQKRTNEFLGKVLLKSHRLKEKDLLAALSEQFNIPFVSLRNQYIDWQLVKTFSSSLVQDYKCFPIGKDKWSITVAITNPLDVWALKKVEEEARDMDLKWVLVSESDMSDLIERYRQHMRSGLETP